MRQNRKNGFIMLLALVFGAVFLFVLTGLTSYTVVEHKITTQKNQISQAFSVAEAGLEYYRWHLAHYPTDLQNGTGHAGPYAVSIPDPQGSTAGTATLAITSNTACGLTTSINLSSSGASASGGPSVTLVSKYAQPSVALYSYILNDNVWVGADHVISGPYHSNGGIRMDGTTNAPVTSSVSTWSCTSSFGCSPTATKVGVWGAGANTNFWDYPVPQVDFAAISANFTTLKNTATASGVYLSRYSSGNANSQAYWKGYHLIFNSNGTVTVKKVTASFNQLDSVPIDGSSTSLTDDHSLIQSETTYNTYTIPASCGLIFVEDNAWIEGTISGKVTVVVANVTTAGINPSAVIQNNLSYANTSSGLSVIAANNILIAPNSPQNLTINGVFIAQGGAFGRNLYTCDDPTYDDKGTLTLTGTIVSNKRTGTQWTYSGFGCGNNQTSGYQTRIESFDRRLASDPPPFTPVVSTDYELMDWRQQ